MHETSIAISIYESAQAIAKEHGGRLESVRVAVGELSAVEPDLLRFAWEAVTQNGPDSNSRILIDWIPARQSCPDCGDAQPRSLGSWFPVCEGCGRPLNVEGGRELDILEVIVLTRDNDGDEGKEHNRGQKADSGSQ